MARHSDDGGPLAGEHLTRLVGGFAHEIKNPLSAIGLNLHLMEEELTEPQTVREKRILTRTRRLSKEVQRLQGILEDFLSYVRAPRPEFEDASLGELVREIANLVAPELEANRISLNLLLTEGLEAAHIDARLMHQAVLNLVRNAEQAIADCGRPSGEVIVAVAVTSAGGRRYHEVSVTDNGPGMKPEVLERCFEPYYSTKRGGTGLGLAITRRLVEDQGGTIDVESTEGVGTRFVIRIPSDQEEAAQ